MAAETQKKMYSKFLSYKSNLQELRKNKTHNLHNTELIRITYNHQEEVINPLLLVDGDIFAASLKVFFELHIESKRLTQESKLIAQQLLFKDDDINNLQIESEDYSLSVIVKFSSVLEIFFNLKFLVQKSIFVMNNFIQQLNALFSENIILSSSYPVS